MSLPLRGIMVLLWAILVGSFIGQYGISCAHIRGRSNAEDGGDHNGGNPEDQMMMME